MIDVAGRERWRGAAAAVVVCIGLLQAAAVATAQAQVGDTRAQARHRCAAAATAQARALLSFHAGGRGDVEIDDGVQVLAPLRNPANRRQVFDVLQVQGHVYRAGYRLRLIYARVPGGCVLMGQEVIEESSL